MGCSSSQQDVVTESETRTEGKGGPVPSGGLARKTTMLPKAPVLSNAAEPTHEDVEAIVAHVK